MNALAAAHAVTHTNLDGWVIVIVVIGAGLVQLVRWLRS